MYSNHKYLSENISEVENTSKVANKGRLESLNEPFWSSLHEPVVKVTVAGGGVQSAMAWDTPAAILAQPGQKCDVQLECKIVEAGGQNVRWMCCGQKLVTFEASK